MGRTLYFRNDQHTVNTLTEYQLKEIQSLANVYFGNDSWFSPSYRADVDIIHADGSIINLGENIASVSRSSKGEGYQSATWVCPEFSLLETDAIQISLEISAFGIVADRSFITLPLGVVKLRATTWTFTYYTYYDAGGAMPRSRIYHGDSNRNTRVEGIELETLGDFAGVV